MNVARSLSASIKDVAFYGLMLGVGEAFLGAYFVHQGASFVMLGILATAPQLVSSFFEVASANRVDRTGRRRRIYLQGAWLQTLMWPVIGATVFMPAPASMIVLLAALCLYFGGNHYATPPWNSVMGDLVPADQRGRFFGLRNRVNTAMNLAGLTAAGVALHELAARGHEAWAFAGLFGAAFLARAASTMFLARMDEPPYAVAPEETFSFVDFVRRLRVSSFAKFTFCVAALTFSTNIAAPFFAKYMLQNLDFTYNEFMIGQNVILLTQILAFPYWGRLADRYGNRVVMTVSSFGVAAVPALWLFVGSPGSVYAVQGAAGLFWAGFNLAAGNFILDAESPPKRARCTAYYNLVNGVATFAGGLAGGLLVYHLPTTVGPLHFTTALQTIMLLSFALRFVVAIVSIPLIHEVREVPKVSALGFIYRASLAKSAVDAISDLITDVRGKDEST